MANGIMTSKLLTAGLSASLTAIFAAGLTVESASAQSVVLTLDDGPCSIPLQANSSVTVDATTGNLTLDVDDANLPTCFGTPGGALDVALTLQPDTIDAGNTVDVTWSVTGFVADVTSCTPTGGTQAWRDDVTESPSGGSGTYSPTGTTSFILNCQNSGGSDSVDVTVNGGTSGGPDGFPPPPSFCGPEPAGRTLPFNIFKDFASNPPDGQPKINFEGVWGPFPGSNEATIFIPRGDYVSLPFVSDDAVGKVWALTWVGGPSNGDNTQVSISRCPGDFEGVGYTDALCLASVGSEGATIGTIVGPGNACSITGDINDVYYINIRHTTAQGENACNDGSTCSFLGRPRRLN